MYAALLGWELNFSQNGAACNHEIAVISNGMAAFLLQHTGSQILSKAVFSNIGNIIKPGICICSI